MYSDVAERLKQLLNSLGLNIKEFAQKAGIPYRTAQDYLLGKIVPGGNNLAKIAQTFHVSINWLLTGEGEMFLPEQQEVIPVKPIPIIDVYVPAGVPEMPPDKDQIIDYLYLPVNDLPNNNLVAIRVRGNSMYPTIKEGELVVFETNPINIRNGDIVIVRNEWNELMLKRYRKRGDEVYLVSDNPEYPTIRPNELYKIVGKVVKIVSVRNP